MVVVNLSNTPLDDATHSVLLKGVNFAVFPLMLLTEDIIGGKKATGTLLVEAAEEVWQETKKSSKCARNQAT